MKFGLALGLVCAAHVACAVPTADAPTTDGTALVGLGKSSSSPAAALQRYVDSGEIAGAVSMVAVSGKVETAYVGLADPTTGRPFDGKTLFWIASMTKGFCGAAVMSCVDKGLLSLDDPVEKYIPEIADVQVEEKGPDGKTVRRPPKTKMTIRMCLSHVAGYPFSTPLELERGALNLSMAEHVKGAVECPLLRDPLTAHQYSNVDINLAGRVVEIVTGMAFEDYLQKTFFDPLGMKDITFYPTAEQLSRKVYVARVANGRRYEDGRGDQWAKMLDHREIRRGREHAIAAGGLYSTPADVMKFYLMLANDGKAPDGTRILSHASILELSRAQYPHLDRYSLGLRQFGDWFGHDGALQTEAYANWKENRVALLFVQVTGSWDHRFKLDWRASAMAASAAGEGPFRIDRSAMSEKYWEIWNDAEQAAIDEAIERNRKADGEFLVPGAAEGTVVKVEQIGHEFRFGAHIFNFNQLGKTEWNDAYKASYGKGGLFNQATVAFYWSAYEPVPGRLRAGGDYEDTERYWNSLSVEEAQLERFWRRPAPGPVVDFLKAKDVAIHGHILIWGSAKPDWIYDTFCPEEEKRFFDRLGITRHSEHLVKEVAGASANFGYNKVWKAAWRKAYGAVTEDEVVARAPVFVANMRRLFHKRVNDVAGAFGEMADSWDVVNESSYDWTRYRKSRSGEKVWFSGYGLMPGDYPLDALLDAKAAFPARAKLAINDYNISSDFLEQVKDLEAEGAKIDIVGCQMHIFNTNDCMRLAQGATDVNWVGTPKTIRDRLDMMAKTGRPLHVSEVTITSPGADDRSRMIQAILARNIYRAWFSHPKTMGITWWNTVDGGGVKGEPLVSGLFTRDMRKKPAYLALDQLINREWMTRLEAKAKGEDGRRTVSFRGFRGRYRLSWTDANGRARVKVVDLTGTRTSDLADPVPVNVTDGLPEGVRFFGEARVSGPIARDKATARTAAEADRLAPLKAVRLGAHGELDFGAVTRAALVKGELPDVVAYAAFTMESDAEREIRFYWINDWFGALFVNGEQVGGNFTGDFKNWGYRRIRLKRGTNEILFRSGPGTTGTWKAAFASCALPTVRAPDDGITRVLIIGNSFSACVMDHLPPVAADRGVKLDVCSLFIGGCSLARHWKNACLDGTPDEPKPYLLTRDTCGKGETNHINVCTALRMEDWDIVTVQQASGDSWRAETYGPEGDRLVAKIRELAPHAKVYVQETWSYTPWDKRLKKWGITPDEMYAKLHAAYAAFARRNGLDIIPFGAAVQEWRRRLPVRYTANSFGGDVIGEDVLPADTLFKRNAKGEWVINCDAFHTGQRGNYFQGLVWAATLLGIDPEAVGYRPDFVTESDGRLMKRIAKELTKE